MKKYLYKKLIHFSEWTCFVIFNREQMTLSALAHEVAHLKQHRHSVYSCTIDILFWFDINHCRNAYVWYRFKRMKRYRSMIHARSKTL